MFRCTLGDKILSTPSVTENNGHTTFPVTADGEEMAQATSYKGSNQFQPHFPPLASVFGFLQNHVAGEERMHAVEYGSVVRVVPYSGP